MKQWIVQDKEHDLDGLVFKDAAVPKVGENEVLVKLQAASLNYRDLIIPKVRVKIANFKFQHSSKHRPATTNAFHL
jgi:NADPH:quinone reductase-like Zn-dependent oxidoreductase